MDNFTVDIIIPLYNESSQVEHTFQVIDILLSKNKIYHNFIFVDDGSSDDTWHIVKYLSSGTCSVTALKLSRNFGKEAAICAGLESAGGDCCILMDADLQHPPEIIPEMVRLWKNEGYEVVEGVKSSRGKESLINKTGAGLFYSIMKKLSGHNLKSASDFKLLDREVVSAWKMMKEKNTFFRGMSAWVGFKRTSIPFSVGERSTGRSRWSVLRLSKLAVNAITSFSSMPLQIVTLLGSVLLGGSVIMGIQTLFKKFTGQAMSGFTTVILLQLIIGSTLMISLGVIGTYIARIYDEVKDRPRYIVSEKTRAEKKEKINKGEF